MSTNNVLRVYEYTSRYYLTHPWTFVRHFARNLKWTWQRATRGYSDYDVADIASFIFDTLPPAIQELNKTKTSHPGSMTFEAWTEVLTDIIISFSQAQEYGNLEMEEDANRCLATAFNLIQKYFWDLWD